MTDRILSNRSSGGAIQFSTNVGGTPTQIGIVSNAGAWTFGLTSFTGTHAFNARTLRLDSDVSTQSSYSQYRRGTTDGAWVGIIGSNDALVVGSLQGDTALLSSSGRVLFGNTGSTVFGFASSAGAWTLGVSGGNTTQTLNGGVRFSGNYYQNNAPGANWISTTATPTHSIVMFGAGGPFNVCGMAFPANAGSAPYGMILIVINRAAGTISVLNESGTETSASSRFRTKAGATLLIPAGEAKQFIWSETSLTGGGSANRWIEL